MDVGNYIVGGLGTLNLGVVVYVVRLVVKPLAESVKTLTASVKELYESRNAQASEIVQIQTIHRIRGCELPEKK